MNKIKSFVVFVLLITFILVMKGYGQDKVVVIVNKDNPVNELTAGQAKLYFLRKLKRLWPETNKPIKPVDRDDDFTTKEIFYGKVLGMQSSEVVNYFKQRQFANSETPPARFKSDEEIVRYVSENEGAIGYISLESYQENKNKVKAILNL